MTPRTNNSFRVTINRHIVELDACKDHLNIFLHENLAVYEALVNIYDHESKKFKKKPIIVDCEIDEEQIVSTITYEGNEFDITNVVLPDIVMHFKKGKKRGLGIYFIRTLMDNVTYHYNDSLNRITLVKKIPHDT